MFGKNKLGIRVEYTTEGKNYVVHIKGVLPPTDVQELTDLTQIDGTVGLCKIEKDGSFILDMGLPRQSSKLGVLLYRIEQHNKKARLLPRTAL